MLQADRRAAIVLAAALFLSVPLMPLELWVVKLLIDRIQAWAAGEPIGPIVAIAAGLAALLAVGNIALGAPAPIAATRLMEAGTLEEQRLLLSKTSRLPLASLESPAVKDMRERAIQASLYGMYDSVVTLLQSLLRFAVLLAVLAAYGEWLPAAAVVVAALLHAAVSGRAAESMESLSREQASGRRLLRHYAGLLTKREAAKEVRLFGLGPELMRRWSALYAPLSRERQRAFRGSELRKAVPELATALLGGLLVALLVLMPGAEARSAGDFALLLLVLTMLTSELPGLSMQGAAVRAQRMRWADFAAYMSLEEDRNAALPSAPAPLDRTRSGEGAADGGGRAKVRKSVRSGSPSSHPTGKRKHQSGWLPGHPTEKLWHQSGSPSSQSAGKLRHESGSPPGHPTGKLQLEARGLRFRYPGAASDTLEHVSLTIPPGCRAALVGENGSGKSTLVKLLTGLYAPGEGTIVWNDVESRCTGCKPSPVSTAAVFQDFTRLYLTLRDNVAIGRLEALKQDAVLQSALRASGSRMRELDAQLGAAFGGTEPSGGEWQKIATARAMLREADFVFFDEPTAALDPEAEKEAFELFLRATEGKSALLVTHRLGAARLAELILVLKDGRLAEQGTHDELMRQNGEYSRMFRQQASWYTAKGGPI